MTAGYVILGMTESDYEVLMKYGEYYFRYGSEIIATLTIAISQGWDVSLGGLKNICKISDGFEDMARVAFLQKVFGPGGSMMYMLIGRIQEAE